FRVVRPGTGDVAGIHSESSYGIHPLTIWIPAVGFAERYTLKVSPGSHAKGHPADAIQITPSFMARPYKKEYVERFSYVRPNLRKGQALVFHPDLLHGGSANLGEDTRVSIEVRAYPADEKETRLG